MDAETMCDSEEEVFCGPVTRRELELMKRRKILFRKTEVLKPKTPRKNRMRGHVDTDSDDDKENAAPLPASLKTGDYISTEHKYHTDISHCSEHVDQNASSKLNNTEGTLAPPSTPEPHNDGDSQPLFSDKYIEQMSRLSKRSLSCKFMDNGSRNTPLMERKVLEQECGTDESFENVGSPMTPLHVTQRLLEVLDSICETEDSLVSCESMHEDEINLIDASLSSSLQNSETELDVNPDAVVQVSVATAVEETCSIFDGDRPSCVLVATTVASQLEGSVTSILEDNAPEIQYTNESNKDVISIVESFQEEVVIVNEEVVTLSDELECNYIVNCIEVVEHEADKDCENVVGVHESTAKSSYLDEDDADMASIEGDMDHDHQLHEKMLENKEETITKEKDFELCCAIFETIELTEDQYDQVLPVSEECVDDDMTSVALTNNDIEILHSELSLNVSHSCDEVTHKNTHEMHDLSGVNSLGDKLSDLSESITKATSYSLESLEEMVPVVNEESDSSVLNIDTSFLSDLGIEELEYIDSHTPVDVEILEENVPVLYKQEGAVQEVTAENSAHNGTNNDASIFTDDSVLDTLSSSVPERPSFITIRKKKYSTFFRTSNEDDKEQVPKQLGNVKETAMLQCMPNVLKELSINCNDDDNSVQTWSQDGDCKILASPNLCKLAEMSKKYQHNEDASKSEKDNYFLNALHRRYGNAKLTTRMSDLSLKSPPSSQEPSLLCVKERVCTEMCLNQEATGESCHSPTQDSKQGTLNSDLVVEQQDISVGYTSEKETRPIARAETPAEVGHVDEYSVISEPEENITSNNNGLPQNVKMLSVLDTIPPKHESNNINSGGLKEMNSLFPRRNICLGNISSVSADNDGGYLSRFTEIALQYDKNDHDKLEVDNKVSCLLSSTDLGNLSSLSADEDGGFLSRFTDIALKHAHVQSSTPQKKRYGGSSMPMAGDLERVVDDIGQNSRHSDQPSSEFNDTLEEMMLLETYGMDYVLGKKDRFSKPSAPHSVRTVSHLHNSRVAEEHVPHMQLNICNTDEQLSEKCILQHSKDTRESVGKEPASVPSCFPGWAKVDILSPTPLKDNESKVAGTKKIFNNPITTNDTEQFASVPSCSAVKTEDDILSPAVMSLPLPRNNESKVAGSKKFFNNTIATNDIKQFADVPSCSAVQAKDDSLSTAVMSLTLPRDNESKVAGTKTFFNNTIAIDGIKHCADVPSISAKQTKDDSLSTAVMSLTLPRDNESKVAGTKKFFKNIIVTNDIEQFAGVPAFSEVQTEDNILSPVVIPPTPECEFKTTGTKKFFNDTLGIEHTQESVVKQAQSDFTFAKPKNAVVKQHPVHTHKVTPNKNQVMKGRSPGRVSAFNVDMKSPSSHKSIKGTPSSASRIPRKSPVVGCGLKKSPSPVISSGMKKNSYFSKIQSPVGAYIKNLSVPPLVINKNLPVIGASRLIATKGTCDSKKKKLFPDIVPKYYAKGSTEHEFIVDAENVDSNNVVSQLPRVSYQRAPALKLDTPSKKKLPHMTESMKRLFEAPVTHVLKHKGRVKMSHLEGSEANSVVSPQKIAPHPTPSDTTMPSSRIAEISVVVSKDASRTNTLDQ